MRNRAVLLIFLAVVSVASFAGKKVVLTWPPEKPVIRVTFGEFLNHGTHGGKSTAYTADLEIENIGNEVFPASDLTLVFYDKENAIIGNSVLYIAQRLEPRQKIKQEVNFSAVGKAARVAFGVKDVAVSRDRSLAVRTVSMTVRSVPSGAVIDIDGVGAGLTPQILRVPVGSHVLRLSKPGYNDAEHPFEVRPEDANGGSIEVELPASNDILEMRDGSAVTGDVVDITWESVRVQVGEKEFDYPRNRVKRIILVQRQVPAKGSEAGNPSTATQDTTTQESK